MTKQVALYLLILFVSTALAYDVCPAKNNCEESVACTKKHDTRACNKCLVSNPFGGCLVRGNDPNCEVQKASQNLLYEQEYAICKAELRNKILECENNRLRTELSANSSKTRASNGELCSTGTNCVSGYCYQGPDQKKYCLSKDFNCSLKGRDGALYGQVYRVNNQRFVCIRPPFGPATWKKVSD